MTVRSRIITTLVLTLGLFSTWTVASDAGERPERLLVDLLEYTDVVWRDGFPTQLKIDQLADVVERVQFAEIRSTKPSFSWTISTTSRNMFQKAWQIQLARSKDAFVAPEKNSEILWDSGKVLDSNSTSVPYGAEKPLEKSTIYYWRVKIWNQDDEPSEWSEIKAFKTSDDYQTFGVSKYPLTKKSDFPVLITPIDENTTFVDFGRCAFGQLIVEIDSPDKREALIRLGERVADGRVDRKPAGTTRFWEYRLELLPGKRTYSIKTRVDKRNSTGAAFRMPEYVGEVMPFRYVEVEFLPESSERAVGVLGEPRAPQAVFYQRDNVVYPFDETSSYFHSDSEALNQVWELCKYSIEATTFAGVYLDGDRERIPYEGDAFLNQLSHYSVDREYSLARYSQEYMIFHPTWPTEWNLQIVQMAWYDYLYTGDYRYAERYYDELKAKSLGALAEDVGLISTRKGKLTKEVLDSIHFKGNNFRDIVDWPHQGLAGNDNAESGETDGFVFEDFNAVVNAYYFFALNSMRRFAEVLNKSDDVAFYTEQIEKTRKAFQDVFFDKERGVYKDGEKTEHASLHGNMFPLAFGLVPDENVDSVTKFVESRGMKCSVYGAQFLLDATYEGNNAEYGLERLTARDKRSWINMIRAGSTITMEAWDDSYKPNQDWNHAWGAAPANIIPRKLVGVEPLEPGCAKLRIKPQLGSLEQIEARVPTIRGSVEVKVSQVDDYQLEISIPGNVKADVYVPFVSESDVIKLDDARADETFQVERQGKYWVISNVGSGVWNFARM